ncbi:MAG: undecaprenyldiphospho-muramoylpentapeptide beta-N-acetylglucosaminyltransferase [Mariprofundaceae bacterium]|nr:undecaprenyldiphospho-muramoylpentapeptide beta-N-acetylglucosaminyltransferase [Mariprofundaceae bacterium]
MKKTKQLCIAGGGTGGHVMPALALADAARETWKHLDVSFIGAERGLEAKLLPERGEHVLLLRMHAIQGAGILQKLRVLCWEMPKAVLRIRQSWKKKRPDVLVGVGGYASATGVLAALLSGIPVILYEQNAVPGLVNRTLARFCKQVMLGFSQAAQHLPHAHCMYTGNIVRNSIAEVQWQAHKIPCLLVMGGSQGARFLNEKVPLACQQLKQEGFHFRVLHVCGNYQNPQAKVLALYQEAGIDAEVMPFCHDMPNFYAQGDVMMARAGAMSVSEASIVGMPCIFVPLPHAADQHQWFNAQSVCEHGGGICISQHETSLPALVNVLKDTLCQPKSLHDMHQVLKRIAKKDAKTSQLNVLSPWLES